MGAGAQGRLSATGLAVGDGSSSLYRDLSTPLWVCGLLGPARAVLMKVPRGASAVGTRKGPSIEISCSPDSIAQLAHVTGGLRWPLVAYIRSAAGGMRGIYCSRGS